LNRRARLVSQVATPHRAHLARHAHTAAVHSVLQVLLRWGLQKGAAVIPKSVQPARIAGFAPEALLAPGSFIPAQQMRELDGMEDGHKYCWDPTGIV
jgi:diketogulonate reductase-like aldo/keto reductase